MASYDKENNIIVHGHRPTGELDRNKPPKGRSVVTKQLKAIRESMGLTARTSVPKKGKE